MLIENAEQFGLAQLHQLRGRIGRGAHKSYCILEARAASLDAWQRLKIMEETSNGFRIAEEDFKLRGMGIARREILHVAESLFHDHVPANRHGLDSCWIWRRHADEGYGATMNPGSMPTYNFRFTSMGELADAHRAATAGG